ncbi:MAG: hypothetical protein HGA19_01795 [Oscillochloris sp.]|nr:hypothetical protein [Oscillochloris sp.]
MRPVGLLIGLTLMLGLLVAPAPALVAAQGGQDRIVFTSDRDGGGSNYMTDIYTMYADGSGLTRLTTEGAFGAVWSPDGTRIAFVSFHAGFYSPSIALMNADGSHQTRLIDGLGPAWSPDGTKVAFYGAGIEVIDADGRNLRSLTSDGGQDPAWSPDGTKLAFAFNSDNGSTDIYVMNADGSNRTRLTTAPDYDSSPAWSPDGTKIAFASDRSGYRQIYVMNADGSSQTRLTSNEHSYNLDPAWSPDGRQIIFASMRDGNYQLYVMNPDGSNQTRLTQSSDSETEPSWARPAGTSAADARLFPETGYSVAGRIRSYWEQNGGLAVFGYPITAQQAEQIEGQTVQAQWFERNRLELHPENTAPYDVLLGRLGADRLAQRGYDWQAVPRETPQAGCRYFSETGRNVCGAILAAWRANGLDLDGRRGLSESENLALFGLPLTGLISETLSDGREYQVQYFERARFELHPENAAPYNVLLGLLGNEVRAAR